MQKSERIQVRSPLKRYGQKIEGGTFGSTCRIECMFSHGGCCLELRTDTTMKLGGIRETRESK